MFELAWLALLTFSTLAADARAMQSTQVASPEAHAIGATRVRPEQELVCRVVDSNGEPIMGASVEVLRCLSSRIRQLVDDRYYTLVSGYEYQPVEHVLTSAITTERGSCAFQIPAGRDYDLRASRTGFAPKRVNDVKAGGRTDVVLSRAATVSGIVARSTDGRPVAGAELRFHATEPGSFHVCQQSSMTVFTDAEGSFSANELGAGDYWVEVSPAVECPARISVSLKEGELRTLRVEVEPGITAFGAVRDELTLQPLAGAVVRLRHWSGKAAITDALGFYDYPGFNPNDGQCDLEAWAEMHGRAKRNTGRTVDGRFEVNFTCAPGRGVRGRVLAPDGVPVHGALVGAVFASFHVDAGVAKIDAEQTREDGVFALEHLELSGGYTLSIHTADWGAMFMDLPPAEESQSFLDLGDIGLHAPSTIGGVVVDSRSGNPAPGVPIYLRGVNPIEPNSSSNHLRRSLWREVRETRTDAEGRFWITDLDAGRFEVSLQPHKSIDASSPSWIEVGPGESVTNVKLVTSARR